MGNKTNLPLLLAIDALAISIFIIMRDYIAEALSNMVARILIFAAILMLAAISMFLVIAVVDRVISFVSKKNKIKDGFCCGGCSLYGSDKCQRFAEAREYSEYKKYVWEKRDEYKEKYESGVKEKSQDTTEAIRPFEDAIYGAIIDLSVSNDAVDARMNRRLKRMSPARYEIELKQLYENYLAYSCEDMCKIEPAYGCVDICESYEKASERGVVIK